jgi:polar amino acid transport system substrate-binding protein
MKLIFLLISFIFLNAQLVKNAYYDWLPYQYLDENNQLTGLDIELLKKLFSKMSYQIDYKKIDWNEHLSKLATGSIDIAAGAVKTDEREKYAFFSEAYRSENICLYYQKESAYDFESFSVEEILEFIKNRNLKVGIIGGYQFNDSSLNRFVNSDKNKNRIHIVKNDIENFNDLFKGKSNILLADRLVASTLIWKNSWQDRISLNQKLISSAKIHIMFSKASLDSSVVSSFNNVLAEFKESGEYNELIRNYISPIMLNMTVGQNWFFWIDILGTIAFALSGIILARDEKYDLTGAFVLATLPAVGGGAVRDLVLGRELTVLKNPIYLYVIISLVIIGFIVFKLYEKLSEKDREQMRQVNHVFWNLITKYLDALGLAAFTITGVVVAFEMNAKPFWLWGALTAMLTGAGGGILRDVVRADANNPSIKGSFYPELALIWGLILSVLIDIQSKNLNPDQIFYSIISVMLLTFLSRVLVMKYNIKSPFY